MLEGQDVGFWLLKESWYLYTCIL